jgi:F-type H+-transporting ATPase subunit epsilon
MALFASSLITPERILVDEDAQAVFLRTGLGDAAFMAGHTALVGSVEGGLVRFVHEDGTETRAAVHGGFVQVFGDRVSVLCPVAERSDEIDVARARAALEAAHQRIAALSGGAPGEGAESEQARRDVAQAEAARRRAEVRLEVAGASETRGA